eukprot:scaffold310474_cov31-Prasinocladus_malaysianus.AAC.1
MPATCCMFSSQDMGLRRVALRLIAVRCWSSGVKLTVKCDCCHIEGMLDSPHVQITGTDGKPRISNAVRSQPREIPAEAVASQLGRQIRRKVGMPARLSNLTAF